MATCPLKVKTSQLSHPVEDSADGWYLPAARGLRGTLKAPQNALICRIAPGKDAELMQFGIGDTTSTLCNSLFLPDLDEVLTFTAEGLQLEKSGSRLTVHTSGPLQITRIRDYMKVHRKLPWFKPMDRSHFPTAPVGWCSWYYYYFTINEAETLLNTDWIAKNLKDYGCDIVQIDEGWQDNGAGFGANRNFLVTNPTKFPRGMKFAADYIRKKGLTPGLWSCPLGQSDTTLFANEPDTFIRHADGTSVAEFKEPKTDVPFVLEEDKISEWGGRYYIDPTSKKGKAYLKRLLTMFCKEWGYDYIKIDGQIFLYWAYMIHRSRLSDPSLDAEHAYRMAMDSLMKAMGPKRFLLNCGEGFSSVGQCQGIRIGSDVGQSWKGGVEKAAKATAKWGWLNTLAFYTDPDVVCVRDVLPYEQARAWTVLLGMTGQLLMTGDNMYKLQDDRVELLKRIMPVADIHPMELYPIERDQPPSLINLKVKQKGVGSWDVVAAFNWSETESKSFDLRFWRLGLPRGRYLWLDIYSGKLLTSDKTDDDNVKLTLPPACCRLLSVWPELDHPQFIGSSRHITQGAIDIKAVKWDAKRKRLSGTCELVAGNPTLINIHVPAGYKAKRQAGFNQVGRLGVLTLKKSSTGKCPWSVSFTQSR